MRSPLWDIASIPSRNPTQNAKERQQRAKRAWRPARQDTIAGFGKLLRAHAIGLPQIPTDLHAEVITWLATHCPLAKRRTDVQN